jgi:hypothetical protein
MPESLYGGSSMAQGLMRLSVEQVGERLTRAFDELVGVYRESGGHLFPGFSGWDDPENYKGPTIWSEGDGQFRFALALEQQFPGMVHLEVPAAAYMFHDFVKGQDSRQFIDIVVSDLSDFDPKNPEHVFAHRQHDVFIEVKYAGVSSKPFLGDTRKKIFVGVPADLRRLEQHLDRRWCKAAAVLLIDDGGHLDSTIGRQVDWSTRVRPFLLSPRQLGRLDMAKQLNVTLPPACPACGSPRLAAILHGLPPPELEKRAREGELVLGGCEILGFDLDPTYSCLDCKVTDSRFDPQRDAYPPQ